MKAHRGFTLIEVVAAMLVSCVMISAVFSVALSNKQTNARSDRRLVAAQAAQSLTLKLADYVTADASNTPTTLALAPGGLWSLPGDSLGNVYALCGTAAGTAHVLGAASPLVPTQISAAPFNGTLTYTVTWAAGCNVACPGFLSAIPVVNCQPKVDVKATWTEP
jgi:prepilin-type N-terminal cleavage/methylation domain-containing protein